MKLAVPDMISNSYFPVLAAVELGFFRKEGLDVHMKLMSPADKAYGALRKGDVDFVGAEAHSALAVFPEWRSVKLLCAQSQGMHLVPRDASRSRCSPRRCGDCPRPPHRRGALGGTGTASPAHRGRHRTGSRQRHDR